MTNSLPFASSVAYDETTDVNTKICNGVNLSLDVSSEYIEDIEILKYILSNGMYSIFWRIKETCNYPINRLDGLGNLVYTYG